MTLRAPQSRLAGSAVVFAVVTALTAFPVVANAQQPAPAGNGCPPGSWFCAETTAPPAPPPPPPPPPAAGTGTGPGVTISTEPPPPPPPPPYTYGGPSRPPPPVVIYQPGPRIVAPVSRPPMYLYTPRPRPRPEWGLNLHVQGGPLRSKYDSVGAHMEGGGAGLRFRPVPVYALEADLDFYGGRDYNDFTRNETAFTINNYFFVNPHDRLQLYLLAGLGWSVASAFDDNRSARPRTTRTTTTTSEPSAVSASSGDSASTSRSTATRVASSAAASTTTTAAIRSS